MAEEQGQSIGAARIDIVIDLDAYRAEIDRAKNLAAGLGKDFEASFAKMTGSSKRATSEALKLSQTWGKNADEIKLLTLAARGAAPEALEALRTKMAAVRAETAKGGTQLNAYGISAKQTAAALRGVPAQLTDITVSLASGQRPLTVLLQQGGQLKDMFGGIKPAAQALGGALLSLINPYTVLAATAVVLFKAFADGSKENREFAQSILLTGNAAGTTVGQLQAMAENVDQVVGTQHKAADVLAQLVATGKVANRELQSSAIAAIQLENAAGISVAETVKNLAALGDKPVEASRKLNEQYRYLKVSVYEQIRALEDQGRHAEAAALAQSQYQEAIQKTASKTAEQLGLLQNISKDTKKLFEEMWDGVLNVGRPRNSLQDQLSDVERELRRPRGGGRFEVPESRANMLEGRRNSLLEAIRLEKLFAQQDADAQTARAKALADSDTIYAQQQKDRDSLQKYLSDRRKAQLGIDIAALQSTAAAEVDTISNAQNLLEARRAAGLISEKDYYEQRRQLIEQTTKVQAGALSAENRRLSQESTRLMDEAEKAKAFADSLKGTGSKDYAAALATASQKQDEARRAKLQNDAQTKTNSAEITKLTRDQAAQTEILALQEKARGDALIRSYEQAKAAADNYLATLTKQYRLEEAGQFSGNQQRARDSGRAAIGDKYAQQAQQVEIDRSNNPTVDPKVYEQRLALVKDTLAKELALFDAHWAKLREGEASWTNGAMEALRNYADEAANTAKVSETIFSNAFRGIEDSLTDGLSGAGFKFSKLIDTILADITRLLVVRPLLASLFDGPATGGTGAGLGAKLFSGISSLFSGGRAAGGSVNAGRLYRVNEIGVEALRIPGHADYLMTDRRGGEVVPNHQIGTRSLSVVQNIYRTGPTNRRTATQDQVEAGRRLRIAAARFN